MSPGEKKSHIFTLLKIKHEQRPPFHIWDEKKKCRKIQRGKPGFSNARGDHENISTQKQRGISERASGFSRPMLY